MRRESKTYYSNGLRRHQLRVLNENSAMTLQLCVRLIYHYNPLKNNSYMTTGISYTTIEWLCPCPTWLLYNYSSVHEDYTAAMCLLYFMCARSHGTTKKTNVCTCHFGIWGLCLVLETYVYHGCIIAVFVSTYWYARSLMPGIITYGLQVPSSTSFASPYSSCTSHTCL